MYSPSKVGEKKKKDKTETRHGLGKGAAICQATHLIPHDL